MLPSCVVGYFTLLVVTDEALGHLARMYNLIVTSTEGDPTRDLYKVARAVLSHTDFLTPNYIPNLSTDLMAGCKMSQYIFKFSSTS